MLRYNRVAMLVNLTLLGLGLSMLIVLPKRSFTFVVFGSPLTIAVSGPWQMGALLLAITCAGVESIIRSHPLAYKKGLLYTFTFWSLPSMLTLGAMVILQRSEVTLVRLITLGCTALLLGIAIAAQYRTVALDDPWRRPARLILNLFVYVVTFALYLAIYGAKSRSLISATEISLVSTLLTLEMLRGTTTEISRIWLNAGVVGLLMGEVTWVFNYWAISGTEGGLLLLLLFYFLSGIAQQSLRNRLTKRVLVEYGLITLAGFVILWFYTRWDSVTDILKKDVPSSRRHTLGNFIFAAQTLT